MFGPVRCTGGGVGHCADPPVPPPAHNLQRLILSGAAQQLLLSPTVVRNESAARMYLKGSSKLQRQAASATSSTKPAAAVLRLPLPFGSGSGSGAARNAGGAKPAAELLVGLAAAAAQEAAAASGGQLGALQLVERGGEILRCWQAVARATDKAGDQRRGWAAAMMTEEGQDALAALKPWLPPAASRCQTCSSCTSWAAPVAWCRWRSEQSAAGRWSWQAPPCSCSAPATTPLW